jgi:sugar/nucleoside kinase (ribokinase family)
VTYLEGYLFDPPEAQRAFRRAAAAAHAAGRQVALSLSDAFCVDRHRAEFLELVKQDVALAGLTGGKSPPVCGRPASIAAAEVISHYGARPQADLRKLAAIG